MAISSPGIGSNLDVNGIVSQLMTIEQQPLKRVVQKEAGVQAKLSAYGSIKSALSSFQSTMASLASASQYTTLSATSSDSASVSVSSNSLAKIGTNSIDVTTLAKAQRLVTSAARTFSSVNDAVGTGTITLQYGTYDSGTNTFTANSNKAVETVTIGSSDGSLAGLRDAINKANVGVTASIVNDGTGFRLALAVKDSGTSNSVRLTVADDDGNNTDTTGLSQLAYDPTAAADSGKNITVSQAAQDAVFTVDGITITKPTNTVTDAIQGVTLTLNKATNGTPVNVSVSRNSSAITTAAQNFVKAYNDLNKSIQDLTSYNSDTKTAAILQGEAAPRSILQQIKSTLNTPILGLDGSRVSLAQIGLTFQKDGSMALDSSKLSTAVQNNPDIVAGFFANTGRATDPNITYRGSASSTAVGGYAVNVSQMATASAITGSGAPTLNITAANNTLSVVLDGVASTVNLTAKAYTSANALAAEIQSQINGSSAIKSAGTSVTVGVDKTTGNLTISSNTYGASSSVSVSGTAATAVFGGNLSGAPGLDVAGTIGGSNATGSGQTLTADNGIKLSVTSGTTGDRGTVYITRGYGSLLDTLSQSLLKDSGTMGAVTQSLQNQIKAYDKEQERINRRLTETETRLRAQYTALDQLMGQMKNTSNYLSQQLASLSSSK